MAVVEIFSGTLWEAELVHSLLTDAGIESFVGNKAVSDYMLDPIRASAIKVMILDKDIREARLVIEQFTKNQSLQENEGENT